MIVHPNELAALKNPPVDVPKSTATPSPGNFPARSVV